MGHGEALVVLTLGGRGRRDAISRQCRKRSGPVEKGVDQDVPQDVEKQHGEADQATAS